MAKNETPTLPELYEGVQNGEYIPYICTGDEWVPWDKELALEALRARAETLGAVVPKCGNPMKSRRT